MSPRREGKDRCHGSKNDDGLIARTIRLSFVGRRPTTTERSNSQAGSHASEQAGVVAWLPSPPPRPLSLVTGVAIEAPKWRCPPVSLHYLSTLVVHLNSWEGIDALSSSSSSMSSVSSSFFLPTFVFPLFRPSFILLDSSGFLVSSGSSSRQSSPPDRRSSSTRVSEVRRGHTGLLSSRSRVLLLLFYSSRMQSHQEAVHCPIRNFSSLI